LFLQCDIWYDELFTVGMIEHSCGEFFVLHDCDAAAFRIHGGDGLSVRTGCLFLSWNAIGLIYV
jgi:hypothetical protein